MAMTKKEQQDRVAELIRRSNEINQKEYKRPTPGFPFPFVDGPMFRAWMGEINTLNERYFHDHPLYSDIKSMYEKRNNETHAFEYMVSHLNALYADNEYWTEEKTGSPLREDAVSKETGKTGIFISHRTCDKEVADMLVDFLVNLGIPRDVFFCSSLPGNDVQVKISDEVKQSIKDSGLNIAILSDAYYESAYCLNEAGILWYLDTPVISIALPEIDHTKMIGFLDGNYKIRRLDNEDDLSFICDKTKSIFSVSPSTASDMMREIKAIIGKYHSFIDKREKSEGIQRKAEKATDKPLPSSPLDQVKELLKSPSDWIDEDSHYYHKQFPYFTVKIEYEEDEKGIGVDGNKEYYHYLQCDSRTQYGVLKVFYHSTQLYSCQVTSLDGHRMIAPCPEWLFLKERMTDTPDICSKYYVTSDFPYILLRFLEYQIGENNGHEAQSATRRLLEVVLLFDDKTEVEDYRRYALGHRTTLDELAVKQRKPVVSDPSEQVVEIESKRIRYSYALKELQKDWAKAAK